MSSPQTLKNVQADVEDGIALGLYSTPMIFINGVEFKGWQTPGAFRKTVEQVAAAKPAARTAAADRPVLAAQRFVDDWKESPESARTEDKTAWWVGVKPGDAAPNGERVVEVVVYGDYQEENTIKLNEQVMEAMKGRTNVRYVWRQYPVDPTCNPGLPPNVPAGSVHPLACKAAKAAEAAGGAGGERGVLEDAPVADGQLEDGDGRGDPEGGEGLRVGRGPVHGVAGDAERDGRDRGGLSWGEAGGADAGAVRAGEQPGGAAGASG